LIAPFVLLCLQIVSCLRDELNRLYGLFTSKNPYFEANGGKTSVVAHSLGWLTYFLTTARIPLLLFGRERQSLETFAIFHVKLMSIVYVPQSFYFEK
jgi:hypothetical protein